MNIFESIKAEYLRQYGYWREQDQAYFEKYPENAVTWLGFYRGKPSIIERTIEQ